MRNYIPALLLIVLLAAWAVFFDRATDYFIFKPSAQIYSLQQPFEEVHFEAPDGTPLHGIYHKADSGKPTLLFFHGSRYNIYSFQDFVLPYVQKGYGIFLFDYRGYGKSGGRPSEQNMYEDARSALFYLMLKQRIFPQDIVLWGFALGCAPALHLASQYNRLAFRAVILQSPFTNMADMGFYMLAQKYEGTSASAILPLFLKPLLWNKTFDNTQKIGQVKVPLFIGFSRADGTIPWTMSRALAAHAPKGTVQFLAPTGIHYNPEWMETAAIGFLEQLDSPPEIDGGELNSRQ